MPNLKFSSIEGNRQKLDGGSMFGNAPRALWEKWTKVDELGRIDLACRALLVQYNGLNILFETGIGAFFEPSMADRFGVQSPNRHRLLENLHESGLSHEQIDYVVLSHLHFDHAGGLLPTYQEIQNGNDTLLFPNAKYLVGQEAWNRALKPHPRDRASFIPGLTDKLLATNRLIIIDNNQAPDELQGILSFYESYGHTPGQLISIIKDNDKKMAYCADLIPGLPWLNPAITMGYDRFPEMLIDEKLALFDQLDIEKSYLFFTHDINYCCSQIEKNEKGKWQAKNPKQKLQGFEL